MNTISTVNSVNNQSFFKLPLIFIGVFFVIYFGAIQILNFVMRDIPIEYLFQMITNISLAMSLPLFLFFVTAFFCCQKYRLHSVANYGPIVGLIGLILAVLYLGWWQLYSVLYSFIIMHLYDAFRPSQIMLWMTAFSYVVRFISYVLFILLLNFLFYIMTKNNATERPILKLEGIVGSRIYAHAYSLLMLFFMILMISLSVTGVLQVFIREFGYDDIGAMILLVIPVFFVYLLVHYMVFYFATRNSFKRIDSTLKIGKLILTVLISYLFIFIASLVIGVTIFLFGQSFIMMAHYMDYNSVFMSIITLFIVSNVVNFILLFVFSRLSVKMMYG